MKIDTEEVIAFAKEQGWPIADERVVRELVFEWKAGLERIINKKRDKEVGHTDAFMAVANFVRLVVEDLEARQKLDTLETQREFRKLMLRTIERGLMQRLMV